MIHFVCSMKISHLNTSYFAVSLLISAILSSCVVVRQDEIAVKRRVGKLVGEPVQEGARLYNPLISTYIVVPTRVINKKVELDIPSKEGLTIKCEMSILYKVDPSQIKTLLREVGTNYEDDLIGPVFRSALADVSSRFLAKDMHTGERSAIEAEVKKLMMVTLKDKGIQIERVLMKRIVLPATLTAAIEEKLAAEQEAQRMEYVLQREKQEAERKKIEAEGIAQSQRILAEGLTEEVLQYQMIQAYLELAKSQNAKVIITNGDTPFLLEQD